MSKKDFDEVVLELEENIELFKKLHKATMAKDDGKIKELLKPYLAKEAESAKKAKLKLPPRAELTPKPQPNPAKTAATVENKTTPIKKALRAPFAYLGIPTPTPTPILVNKATSVEKPKQPFAHINEPLPVLVNKTKTVQKPFTHLQEEGGK